MNRLRVAGKLGRDMKARRRIVTPKQRKAPVPGKDPGTFQ
ncbi:hypothetical protein HMPREF3227_01744 [Corynebacterium sp. CMW7794]|nr:hypothetical protein HMPREF3227_01744 [Corynebacterium sp. CMW7794]